MPAAGALVAELAGEDDPRPARAAAEAEAIARRLGDPDLLALALTAGTMVVNYEQEPERRAFLAAEIGQIGHEHGLPEYEWYAEYIAGTAAAVLGQPGELRRRLKTGQRLADEYRMAEPQAVQLCSEAMLAHVEGRFDDARRHYAEADRADAAQRVAARRRLSRAGAADHRAQRGACGRGRTARPRAVRDDRTPAHERLGGDAGGGRRVGEARRRYQEAARHFATAQQVARRWNSPHWAARARAAASLCPPNG